MEYTYPATDAGERAAHVERRELIAHGVTVSLIGLDTSRDVFAFDATEPCFVCGGDEHEPRELHSYWATSAAMRGAAEHDRRALAAGAKTTPSMSAAETLDPREAIFS